MGVAPGPGQRIPPTSRTYVHPQSVPPLRVASRWRRLAAGSVGEKTMSADERKSTIVQAGAITRRSALTGLAAAAGAAGASQLLPSLARYAHAATAEPIKIGF